MLKPLYLSQSEKKVIKRLARFQIESHIRILSNSIEGEDVPLFCIKEQIALERLHEIVEDELEFFKRTRKNPFLFFDWGNENISISKHLLVHLFSNKKYSKGKRKLRRKLYLIESCNFVLN